MAIALGQTTTGSGWNTSITSGSVNTTTGSTFVVIAIVGVVTDTATVSDSKGNTYTKQHGVSINGASQYMYLWYVQDGTGGSGHTFTVSPGSNTGAAFVVLELTGAKTTGGPDQTTTPVEDVDDPAVIQSITPATSNTLVINASACPAGSSTVSSGGGAWTLAAQTNNADFSWTIGASYRTVGAPTAVNDSLDFVVSGTHGDFAIAFATGDTTPRPSTDVQTTNWASTGANFFGVIDEAVIDDNDYVTSPSITGTGQALICGLSNGPLAAGAWSPVIKASVSSGTATLRIKLLNDSNASQGQVDITVTTTPTRYDPTITTTGQATRISFEFFSA